MHLVQAKQILQNKQLESIKKQQRHLTHQQGRHVHSTRNLGAAHAHRLACNNTKNEANIIREWQEGAHMSE